MKKIFLFCFQFCFMFYAFAEPKKTDTYCLIDYDASICYWCASQTSVPEGNCKKGYAACTEKDQQISYGGSLNGYSCELEGFCLKECPTDTREFYDTQIGAIFLQKRTGCDCDNWETLTTYPIGCMPGFVFVTQRICIPCPDGTTSYSESRTPVGSVYAVCSAKEGYYLETQGGTTTVKQCPDNSTSPAGATSINECKCNAGYYADFSSSSPSCKKCPDNSSSSNGGTNISACKCNAGFYMSGTSCQKCPELNGVAGSSSAGATNISQCYMPSNTNLEDSTGYFKFSGSCSYIE